MTGEAATGLAGIQASPVLLGEVEELCPKAKDPQR